MTERFIATAYNKTEQDTRNIYYRDAGKNLRISETYKKGELIECHRLDAQGKLHGPQRETKIFGVENYFIWRGTWVTPQYFDRLQNQGWTLKNDTDDHWDFRDAQGKLRKSVIFQDKALTKGFLKREADFEYDAHGNLHGEQIKYCWGTDRVVQASYQWHGRSVSKTVFKLAETAADIVGVKPVEGIMNVVENVSARLQNRKPLSPQ